MTELLFLNVTGVIHIIFDKFISFLFLISALMMVVNYQCLFFKSFD